MVEKGWSMGSGQGREQQITLVRHGQSMANTGAPSVAHHAIALSEAGRQQAQALVPLLPSHPQRVLVSPYDRTQATAQPYCAHWGVQAEPVHLLHEFDAIAFALIAGMVGAQRSEVAAQYWQQADPHMRTGDEVETFHEFALRVEQFRQQWLPQLPDRTVVFGHGIWIAMLCWQVWGFDWRAEGGMRRFKRFQLGWPMPNGATYHVRRSGDGPWAVAADEAVMTQMQALLPVAA